MTTALVSAPLAFVAIAPAQAATVNVTLLDVNDFHGRIQGDAVAPNTDVSQASTVELATTVEAVRSANPNTLLLSAGDNIGASLFNSAYTEDAPTVAVLNALGLGASALGNHEFDRGYDWLKSHLIDGTTAGYPQADFDLLGANVYTKGTTTVAPGIKEYSVEPIGGLDVCVIGAITQETASLVSPAGIANLEFGDPVAAVNRVANQLEATPGTCDVTVASYHEGAPDGPTAAADATGSGVFGRIVNQTVGAVDVIFTGHTHQQYALNLAKPGGGTRPVLQTGSYGERLGRVDLTVDDVSGAVTATGSLQAIGTTENLANPVVAEVDQITNDAIAAANVVGDVPTGKVATDITTAYTGGSYGASGYAGGSRDDRASESALGNLVANALKNTPITDTPNLPTPDIGVVNPGGLRNELFYTPNLGGSSSPQDAPGVVTFEEANAVLPFANNISYVTLTGAEFKQVLEQQWQTTADNVTRPSRAFLHLGLSKNVKVTMKPDTSATSPVGNNIETVTIGGKPLDPTREYVVSTFSFLAAGGDNFRAFKLGTNRDTAKVDRNLWIDGYFKNGFTKKPAFDRRQVFATGVPTASTVGDKLSISLSKLNLTSLGAPANTTVEAFAVKGGKTRKFKSFTVTNGAATAGFKVPVAAGGGSVRLVAQPSGTTIKIPVKKASSTVTVVKKPKKATTGKTTRIKVKVKADGVTARGAVKLFLGGKTYTAYLTGGRVVFKLPTFTKAGKKTLRVKYVGNKGIKQDSKKIRFFVRNK